MVDQARECIRVELAELGVRTVEQLLQLDFEVDRARTHHVLDFKVLELHLVADLLDGLCVVLSGVEAKLLALGSGDHHLACFEDQGCSACRFFHSHYYSGKSLGVVFSISALEGNILQIELAAKTRG